MQFIIWSHNQGTYLPNSNYNYIQIQGYIGNLNKIGIYLKKIKICKSYKNVDLQKTGWLEKQKTNQKIV